MQTLSPPPHPAAPALAMISRRRTLQAMAAALATMALPTQARAAASATRAVLGAAWRGPRNSDPNFAGTLIADWEARTLSFGYTVPLPSRHTA